MIYERISSICCPLPSLIRSPNEREHRQDCSNSGQKAVVQSTLLPSHSSRDGRTKTQPWFRGSVMAPTKWPELYFYWLITILVGILLVFQRPLAPFPDKPI